MNHSHTHTRPAFAVLVFLFFLWGFITVMNDLLINTFRDIFSLTNFQGALVQFAFFGAFFVVSLLYFIASRIYGDPINRMGYKNGMAIGLAVCGLGCVLFYPAAQQGSYGLFLGALFVLAAGVTVLQIAANPYAAIMGSPVTASSRLNLAQGFNSLGTTLGPVVGALLIFTAFSSSELHVGAVGKTYALYGAVFLLMAAVVWAMRMPAYRNKETETRGWGALRFPQLRYGMGAVFLYVGAEVAIGSWLIDFAAQPHIMAFDKVTATRFLSWYWGGLMVGRMLGALALGAGAAGIGQVLRMLAMAAGVYAVIYFATALRTDGATFGIEQHGLQTVFAFMALMAVNMLAFVLGRGATGTTLGVFALVNAGLIAVAVLSKGPMAFWAIIGTGLFNSVMWSNIFTLAIAGLGRYTSQASSLLIMSVVGGAIIPPLQGLAADGYGIQFSFAVPLIPYLYLAWYGFNGTKHSG
jgi:FHS family L-fucose permease-like MFS transporter